MSNNNLEVGRVYPDPSSGGYVYPTSSGGGFHVGGNLPSDIIKAAQDELARNPISKNIHGTTSTFDERIRTFNEWLDKAIREKRVLRLWEYKRMFTPYEQQQAFSDESQLVDTHAHLIRLVGGVTLPDGDVMLSYQDADDSGNEPKYYEFIKLSEIKLAYSERDQDDYEKDYE